MLQCWGRFSRLRSVVRVLFVGVGGLGCIGFRARLRGLGCTLVSVYASDSAMRLRVFRAYGLGFEVLL